LAFLLVSASVVNAQANKPFPTDDEINLLLTQADRAIQQYKPLIDQEQSQMGKSYAQAVANDRQVVTELETAVKAFKSKPQAFNGKLGFYFFGMLDDADRNALLCSSGAALEAIQVGDIGKASSLILLAKSCQDASTLIFTVSENAHSLYGKYVEAEQEMAGKAAETLEQCAAILKKQK
jgi:hypothetical protein